MSLAKNDSVCRDSKSGDDAQDERRRENSASRFCRRRCCRWSESQQIRDTAGFQFNFVSSCSARILKMKCNLEHKGEILCLCRLWKRLGATVNQERPICYRQQVYLLHKHHSEVQSLIFVMSSRFNFSISTKSKVWSYVQRCWEQEVCPDRSLPDWEARSRLWGGESCLSQVGKNTNRPSLETFRCINNFHWKFEVRNEH